MTRMRHDGRTPRRGPQMECPRFAAMHREFRGVPLAYAYSGVRLSHGVCRQSAGYQLAVPIKPKIPAFGPGRRGAMMAHAPWKPAPRRTLC